MICPICKNYYETDCFNLDCLTSISIGRALYTKEVRFDEQDYVIEIEAEDVGEVEGFEGGDVLSSEVIEENE
jgi:hypothetical protein